MQLNFYEDGGKPVLSLNEISKEDSEGWLTANVSFDYKGVTANFPIYLMFNDVYAFLEELKDLNKRLVGQARFGTMEQNVDLTLSGDGLGHIQLTGSIRSSEDLDLIINFKIPSDQTFLQRLVTQCEIIVKKSVSK